MTLCALSEIAPTFVGMAHRIVWCTVATTTAAGLPRTRVLHPIWEWDGESLTGWIATSPLSPKADDLASQPTVSLTYWDQHHDTCTAYAETEWVTGGERSSLWERFATGPEPVGYNPSIIPGWDSPDAPAFGGLRLTPTYLRTLPGTLLATGQGEIRTWRADRG